MVVVLILDHIGRNKIIFKSIFCHKMLIIALLGGGFLEQCSTHWSLSLMWNINVSISTPRIMQVCLKGETV